LIGVPGSPKNVFDLINAKAFFQSWNMVVISALLALNTTALREMEAEIALVFIEQISLCVSDVSFWIQPGHCLFSLFKLIVAQVLIVPNVVDFITLFVSESCADWSVDLSSSRSRHSVKPSLLVTLYHFPLDIFNKFVHVSLLGLFFLFSDGLIVHVNLLLDVFRERP
jgi:hypothetical protein